MSAIVGILNLDGSPVDADVLNRMMRTLAHYGADDSGRWIDGAVGLGHLALWTTPEAVNETQPLIDGDAGLTLVMDGRIDNRADLRAALVGKAIGLRTDTDAELVLRAYQCWGESCAARLLGDFAFAIWDARQRRLFCARDSIGIKPFFYYTDGRVFVFGSELRPILELPGFQRRPNEPVIAGYLAYLVTDPVETLYVGIRRLLPAHYLVAEKRSVRAQRYWDIDPNHTIRYRTDREYVEHFREVFEEAVRCRLRTHNRVAADLSGGLDSSSIVSMARWIQREAGVSNRFETFSLVFPGQACDESEYIDAVDRMWGTVSRKVGTDASRVRLMFGEAKQHLDYPGHPNGSMTHSPIYELAQRLDTRVLLGGIGGDDWLTGSHFHYADLLAGLHMVDLVRQIRSDRRYYHDPGAAWRAVLRKRVVHYGVRPLVPVEARARLRKIRSRDRVAPPAWMDAEFCRRLGLTPPVELGDRPRRFPTFTQEELHARLTGWMLHAIELTHRAAARFEIEIRLPFCDRRLVEFAFAVPETLRRRGQQTKYVLREAMGPLLPEPVRTRRTKAEFTHVFEQAFRSPEVAATVQSLATARLGWVSQHEVTRMHQAWLPGDDTEKTRRAGTLWPLSAIVAMELWVTTAFPELVSC